MKYQISSTHQLAHQRPIANITLHHTNRPSRQRAREILTTPTNEVIQHDHLRRATSNKLIHDIRTNRAGTTSHKNTR